MVKAAKNLSMVNEISEDDRLLRELTQKIGELEKDKTKNQVELARLKQQYKLMCLKRAYL